MSQRRTFAKVFLIPSRTALALALLAVACSTRATGRTVPGRGPSRSPVARERSRATPTGADLMIRVALPAPAPRVGATRDFQWYGSDGTTVLTRARAGESWRVEREADGPRVRAVRSNGVATDWQRELYVRASAGGFVTLNGKRYRGEIAVLPIDSGFVLVNRLGLEDYLRGVVPVEMGKRPSGDSAALQAQAVASRSYAAVRGLTEGTAFDVRATTLDQVYGGVDVENDAANEAIDATRGLVLRYQGRIVDAPFHSTCGGTTAEPGEVWRGSGGSGSYLRRVDDRIDNSDRHYCDIAPRYRWTRTLSGAQLDAALQQYLRAYAAVPAAGPGAPRVIDVRERTASGRVGVLDVETEKGIFALRGNDTRYVLRQPGGEILPSTYFSVEPEYRDGRVSRVTFRGRGYGHGVGMCQWGAIGRARAGQSYRTILGTYYPGTSVGSIASRSSSQ